MTEQELMDMFIQEHINMLINTFHKNQSDKFEQEEERILRAEIFIENLPNKEKELVEYYIDSFTNSLALKGNFLYQHGFMDGLKIIKYINKI